MIISDGFQDVKWREIKLTQMGNDWHSVFMAKATQVNQLHLPGNLLFVYRVGDTGTVCFTLPFFRL